MVDKSSATYYCSLASTNASKIRIEIIYSSHWHLLLCFNLLNPTDQWTGPWKKKQIKHTAQLNKLNKIVQYVIISLNSNTLHLSNELDVIDQINEESNLCQHVAMYAWSWVPTKCQIHTWTDIILPTQFIVNSI